MVTILAAVVILVACTAVAVTVSSIVQARKALNRAKENRATQGQPLTPGEKLIQQSTFTDINGREFVLPVGSGDPWFLAFLSSECPACKQQLGRLRRYLRNHGIAPERAITVVAGESNTFEEMTAELAGVSRLLQVEQASPLMASMYISRWPTYVVIDSEDRVAFSSNSVSRLADFGFAQ